MPTIIFEFDGEKTADQIAAMLGDVANKTPNVLANAVNSTARKARKMLLADIRSKYTDREKNKDIIPEKNIQRGSKRNPVAIIHAKGAPKSLQKFNVSPQNPPSEGGKRPSTTRAQVLLQGGLKELEKGGMKAFVTRFKSGDVAVVQRTGDTYKYMERVTRKKTGRTYEHLDSNHDAIRKLWTLGVGKMAGSAFRVGTTMRDDIQETLQAEISKQIEKTLRKAGKI